MNYFNFVCWNAIFLYDDLLGDIAYGNDPIRHHQTVIFNLMNNRIAAIVRTGAVKFGGMHMNDQRRVGQLFGAQACFNCKPIVRMNDIRATRLAHKTLDVLDVAFLQAAHCLQIAHINLVKIKYINAFIVIRAHRAEPMQWR